MCTKTSKIVILFWRRRHLTDPYPLHVGKRRHWSDPSPPSTCGRLKWTAPTYKMVSLHSGVLRRETPKPTIVYERQRCCFAARIYIFLHNCANFRRDVRVDGDNFTGGLSVASRLPYSKHFQSLIRDFLVTTQFLQLWVGHGHERTQK